MQLSELRNNFHHALSTIYPPEEIESLFQIAVENSLGLTRIQLHQNLSKNTSPEGEKKIQGVLDRLIQEEPIQYILGKAPFYDLEFKVSPKVLIPRQETEYLVHLILQELPKDKALAAIDLCTGSACIATSIVKNRPYINMEAMDFSADALQIATQNAKSNYVQIKFIQDDLLNPSEIYGVYDLIICNPPYVRMSERSQMHNNVLQFEPPAALYVEDENPLLFYKSIVLFAKQYLKPSGMIFLEVNEFLGNEMKNMYKNHNFCDVEIIKDLNNKDRFLKCRNAK